MYLIAHGKVGTARRCEVRRDLGTLERIILPLPGYARHIKIRPIYLQCSSCEAD